jgi:hypothetical protein
MADMIKLLLLIVMAAGWVANVVKFITCDFRAPYKAEVLRGVGIVVPFVGCVEGYFTIEDK